MDLTRFSDWTFRTDSIVGRLIGPGDEELYIALYTDPAVMAHIGQTVTVAEAGEKFRAALEHNANPVIRARYWHLSSVTQQAPVGIFALVRDPDQSKSAELGLMLLPGWQGRGIGLQPHVAVVDGALTRRWPLEVDELISRHTSNNRGAQRIHERSGFERIEGEPDGIVRWRMTRERWLQLRYGGGSSSS